MNWFRSRFEIVECFGEHLQPSVPCTNSQREYLTIFPRYLDFYSDCTCKKNGVYVCAWLVHRIKVSDTSTTKTHHSHSHNSSESGDSMKTCHNNCRCHVVVRLTQPTQWHSKTLFLINSVRTEANNSLLDSNQPTNQA